MKETINKEDDERSYSDRYLWDNTNQLAINGGKMIYSAGGANFVARPHKPIKAPPTYPRSSSGSPKVSSRYSGICNVNNQDYPCCR